MVSARGTAEVAPCRKPLTAASALPTEWQNVLLVGRAAEGNAAASSHSASKPDRSRTKPERVHARIISNTSERTIEQPAAEFELGLITHWRQGWRLCCGRPSSGCKHRVRAVYC